MCRHCLHLTKYSLFLRHLALLVTCHFHTLEKGAGKSAIAPRPGDVSEEPVEGLGTGAAAVDLPTWWPSGYADTALPERLTFLEKLDSWIFI